MEQHLQRSMPYGRRLSQVHNRMVPNVFCRWIEQIVCPLGVPTILTILPVAVFGGFATLAAFGSELSLYGYIGVFVLIGLITKNGILMVDFALQRKREGMNSHDAIFDACIVRFRPILMTGLCAILGALPIALGFGADARSRVPLGLVVVGGMVFAQVITLFVTPGIYLYMEKIQDRYFKPRTDLE